MSRTDSGWDSPPLFQTDFSSQDEPGDRFIPTRSLMDIGKAQCTLRRNKQDSLSLTSCSSPIPTVKEEYKRIIAENLLMDSDGKPFKMLVFRGSPKSHGRMRLLDQMIEENTFFGTSKSFRQFPKSPDRVLDAPSLANDYYLNLIDWGQNNILAVALGSKLYLWNPENSEIQSFIEIGEDNGITSIRFSSDGKMIAIGLFDSQIQLWDVATSRRMRNLTGHLDRVGSLAWNNQLLTSGSRDTFIINHDVRSRGGCVSRLRAHTEEVCGLRWSGSGNQLASGANDNMLYVWEASNMASSRHLHRLDQHHAAVKALGWCPFQAHVLASGGGTADRCLKIWDSQTGQCINSVDTESQVCALEWNTHHREIISSHGFSRNQICFWKYPSMTKMGELSGHTARVLHLAQSPDGSTLVSAGADETLRFWKLSEIPQPSVLRREEENLSPLSLKNLQIR